MFTSENKRDYLVVFFTRDYQMDFLVLKANSVEDVTQKVGMLPKVASVVSVWLPAS